MHTPILRSLIFAAVSTIFMVSTIVVPLASAQVVNGTIPAETTKTTGTIPKESASTFTLTNPLKVDSVGGLVQNFIDIFSYIVILGAVLAIIWVGLQFILAQGNSDRIKELKKWLLGIVIGVAVVIGARIIISVVIQTLASTGVVDQSTIQAVQKANSR